MAKLQITTNQAIIVTDIDTNLNTTFTFGTESAGAVSITPALKRYIATTAGKRTATRAPFISMAASLVKALNIPRILPVGLTATVVLAKITPGGVNGSLSFVDGLLTAKTDPT